MREPENQPASEHRQQIQTENQQPPVTKHQQQLVAEQQQLPVAADQQLPMTEHQQLEMTEHQEQLATEQHQQPSAADQQLPMTEHQQQLATEQHQQPSAADQQQPETEHIETEHEKLVGSKASLRQSSQEDLPIVPAIRPLPMMPEVGRSDFLNQGYLMFKYERNPLYIIQCRGVMNVLHLALSLVMIVILGVACQLRPDESDSYSGFFCQPAATFLFVAACGSFFTSVLFFICCMISKKTEAMLFHTFFEAGYYLLYFILLLVGSFCLMDRSYKSDDIMQMYMYNFNSALIDAVSIIGLVNSILYGISAFTFLATHYYYGVFLETFLKRDEQPCDTTTMHNKAI